MSDLRKETADVLYKKIIELSRSNLVPTSVEQLARAYALVAGADERNESAYEGHGVDVV